MSNYNEEVFQHPKTCFQQKINDIMTDNPTKDSIMDLFEIQLIKDSNKNTSIKYLVDVYNLLGFEKFTEMMDILAGKTISFPTKDEFRETILIALAYYYRNVRGYKWGTIKGLLGDDELSSVKYGIKSQQLQKYMENIGERLKRKGAKNNGQ